MTLFRKIAVTLFCILATLGITYLAKILTGFPESDLWGVLFSIGIGASLAHLNDFNLGWRGKSE